MEITMSLDVTLTNSNGNVCYNANITHNLSKMAIAAGIYKELWRPDEYDITHAKQLIVPLLNAVIDLVKKPTFYEQFNASNGWGMYHHFVKFVTCYSEACMKYPDATVSVSR